ncbi:MAG: sulfur reduction protein DsrJ [Candidatus Thiodiazotropha taylori]|nr:sulfur reduction protein DsrJ [Candidatus Thiodiazotropha taylori]MCG7961398.1 sulfur reduction protein DsrJ [Candidatus Thiodiazotropha endolucinida]MCG7893074.1 sulfur reduction protein DsrJ [Candidatus Thiodiazotropha taylori]MCG7905659.1 sulfur reduction protein DsrJ [Candidatus Thiodiazotropha taylori]MCG7911332.1 sulfur reduction protein DsrJ [Candidatus Thiodiazotropha taylori]
MRSSLISNSTLLILLAALLAPAMQVFAESRFVTENSKAASLKSCVAPTDQMRRNHMDYLQHGRDDTVIDGIRGIDYSLSECIDCHASKDQQGQAVSVTDEGQFCQACHEYVAVSPACFQCHRTTPDTQAGAAKLGHHSGDSDPHEGLDIQLPAGIQRD